MNISMSRVELIALIAAMFATIAFSTDSMLPALPEIGAELSPEDPNKAGLILTIFILGLGIGTFFTGPLSDAFGRKPVILGGAVIVIGASVVAWWAPTLKLVLVARFIQGLAIAGPRIVSLAVIRDCFVGRSMAQVMSFVMMIFTLVPALAPAMGAQIIDLAGWRAIFLAFVLFLTLICGWVILRLPETLPKDQRRPFRAGVLWSAVQEMFAHPSVRITILVQALSMGVLFSMLTLVQPIYDQVFGRGDTFEYWFGGVAIVAGSASLVNAALVVKVGMRRMVTWTYIGQAVISALVLILFVGPLSDTAAFALFVAWQVSVFFMAGLTMGNLNAIAMEPMGHIAGMAASVIGGIATVLAALIATIIGLAYNGTAVPLATGLLILCLAGIALMFLMARIEARQAA